MIQEWVKSEFASCALWSCHQMLNLDWCLDWHIIEGSMYAVCQGGHGNDRAELEAQYALSRPPSR